MPAFVLPIQDLDESGRDWNFPITDEWLAFALTGTELSPAGRAGRLEVHAQRNGQDILLQGQIDAHLQAPCARCLEDMPLDVDLPLTALFVPAQLRPRGPEAAEVEVRLDETARDYYGGTEIILDSMVREHLLLEVPMKPLCAEDCEGIAVPTHVQPPNDVFGASAPDPRFAPLLKLKEELTKKEE